MPSIFTRRLGGGHELTEEWKQTGTQSGEPIYAKVVALEPASIGGGGGGVSASVTLADGTTPTQLAAVSSAGEVKTDVADRAARLLGHVTVDNSSFAVTQSGSWTSDVTDRVGRLLGHVTVDNASLAVTLATNTPDVTDRAARLLGHVTVDNASLAVTGPLTDTQLRASAVPVSGTFFQGTQPVSGPLTDTQLRASAVPVDVSDRAARLVGHVSVDSLAGDVAVINSATVGKTKLAVTPDPTDITDRVGRLLGHVTVDNASIAVTGPLTDTQLRATPVPVSGTITANQGTSPWVVKETPATTVGTTISTANASVTLTLTAPGANLFHYITSIEIVAFNPTVTAIAAAATNLAYTSTNLGGLAWNTGTLLAAGAEKVVTRVQFGPPLKSAVANTASTIVAPAIGTGGLVRIQVTYYTAT